MPKPIVAIVGRPNVGKSALFNRLIRQRLSIVEDTPGVTRDRVYANCELYRRSCTLVDTGGLDPTEKDGLISQVAAQAQVAISEASAILFVVEGKEPVTSLDFRLADLLRSSQKPVLLVANKIDDASPPSGEVYGLQLGDPAGVSAIHGLNIDRIIDWLERSLPLQAEESDEQDGSLKIAIVGRPNVGKSALLNALTRQERSIVSEIPGTTRDAIDTRWEWKGRPITLIDTAGMRKRGKVKLALEYYSVLRSLRAIDRADVVFLLVDHEGPMEQDTKIGGYAHEAGRALVLVVNKWDLIRQSVQEETSEAKAQERQERLLRADYERTLRAFLVFMRYAPVAYTSALQRRGIDTLMETAFSVHHQTTQRIPTGPLNRLLNDAVLNNPPSSRKGKPLKLYYATQADVAPPTFVLFVSDPEALHFSYLRYLENQIRKSFGFEGTPLKLVVKAREREERS